MAVDPGDVANVVARATTSAGDIEQTNQKVDAADPGAPEASGFDVWTHTVEGFGDRVAEDPAATDAALADGLGGDYASAGAGDVGSSIEQQAADALSDFELLTGLRDPKEGEAAPEGLMAGVGATFEALTSLEQMISTPLSMIPMPAFPAIRVTDMDVGLPHGHTHPPNVPPTPPAPFPSTGPIIPIPFLSGAMQTLINGMPAARCGDMGLGIWCGGYFPMYEVLLGSSSVWIEGARAGRLLVDVTRHCMFSSPKPSDPPLGPMVGMTVMGSPNVLIGGVPMPSLLDMAMGAAIKGLMKGLGKAVKKLKASKARRGVDDAMVDASRPTPSVQPYQSARPSASSYWERLVNSRFVEGDYLVTRLRHAREVKARARAQVDRMIDDGVIEIRTTDPELERLVREDLYQVAANPVGRDTLDWIDIRQQKGYKTTIEPTRGAPATARAEGADGFWDSANGQPGDGCSTTVKYDPTVQNGPDAPPDVDLHHELSHASNNAHGANRSRRTDRTVTRNGRTEYEQVPPDPEPGSPGTLTDRTEAAKHRYTNLEEQNVVTGKDNPYREQYGLGQRWGHRNMSLLPPGG